MGLGWKINIFFLNYHYLFSPILDKKAVTVKNIIDKDVPKVIQGDLFRLVRVLRAIIENAIENRYKIVLIEMCYMILI